MKDNTQNKLKWSAPKLLRLNFKETLIGGDQSVSEDPTYDS